MTRVAIKPKASEGFQMALFGATTLLGKALRESLERRAFPARSLRMFDRAEREGTLAEFRGEAVLVTRPDPDLLDRVDIAFLCGSSEESRSLLGWPAEKEFVAIDLSKASTGDPKVPLIHFRLNRSRIHLREGIIASPSPVSQALATVLAPIEKSFGLESVVATVFPPASDRGDEGLDELYRQTVNILNFQDLPREVFRRQLAFNLIPQISPSAVSRGDDSTIARETLRVLEADFTLRIGVVQVPVFHCHSILLCASCRRPGSGDRLRRVLQEQEDLKILRGDEDPATPAELAGQDAIHVLPMDASADEADSHWLWIVSDSLRTGAALNAVRIAEWLIGKGGA